MGLNESELTIWICAWGGHIDLLRDYALPSLLQSGNLPACGFKRIHVECCTVTADESRIAKTVIAAFVGLPASVYVRSYPDGKSASDIGLYMTLLAAVERRTRLLIVMPDTIFGNGSIKNICNYARHKPVSVAAAHLRVNTDSFRKVMPKFGTVNNDALVKIAFDCPHQSATASFCNDNNGTLHGGISMAGVSPGLHTIIHYLPTVYLAAPTPEDVGYFANAVTPLGQWDHDWPDLLVKQDRLRIIGSSDIFFAVELTDPKSNLVEVNQASMWSERFRDSQAHNKLCGALVLGLRG